MRYIYRPFGVTCLAILDFISAGLIVAFWLWAQIEGMSFFSSGIVALVTLLAIALGVGMWTCQWWAWFLTLMVCGLSIAGILWESFQEPITGMTLLSVIFEFLIILYLSQPSVRAVFSSSSRMYPSPWDETSVSPDSKTNGSKTASSSKFTSKFDPKTGDWVWEDSLHNSD